MSQKKVGSDVTRDSNGRCRVTECRKLCCIHATQMAKFETMASGVHTGKERHEKGIGLDRQRTNCHQKGLDMMLQKSQTEDAGSHNVKSSAVYMQHRWLSSKQWHQVCTPAVRDKKREMEWTDEGQITMKEVTEQEEWSLKKWQEAGRQTEKRIIHTAP